MLEMPDRTLQMKRVRGSLWPWKEQKMKTKWMVKISKRHCYLVQLESRQLSTKNTQ